MRNQSACAHIAVVRSGLKIDNLFERRRLSPLAFYLRGVIEIAGHNIDRHHIRQNRPNKPRPARFRQAKEWRKRHGMLRTARDFTSSKLFQETPVLAFANTLSLIMSKSRKDPLVWFHDFYAVLERCHSENNQPASI